MNIVIIEDKSANGAGLLSTFKNLNSAINIVAVITSVEEGLQFFHNQNMYDLIFSNAKARNSLCLDILTRVKINKPILFCTAWTNNAIESLDINSINHMPEALNSTASKKAFIKNNLIQEIFTDDEDTAVSTLPFYTVQKNRIESKSVLVYHKDKIMPVAIDSIAIFFIENEAVKIICFNGNIYFLSGKLDEFEKLCCPKFFRANRQFLINHKAVKEVSKFFSRKLLVHLNMSFTQQIIISKTKVSGFLSWLSGH